MPASRYYSRSLLDGRSFNLYSSEKTQRNYALSLHRQSSLASASLLLAPKSFGFDRVSCRWISRTAQKATFYDTLGIGQNASAKDIKTAYYEQSKKWHPDVNPSVEASTKFREVSEAYETLGNDRNRKTYDEKLDATSFSRTGYARPNSTTYRETNMPGYDPNASVFKGRTTHRRAPQSGKDQYWDYDEYYRQHYTQARERQHREAQWRQYQEEYRSQQMARGMMYSKRPDGGRFFLFFAFWVFVFVFIDMIDTEPNPYTMKMYSDKERRAREEYVLRERMRKSVNANLSNIYPADNDSFTGHNTPNNPYRVAVVDRVVMSVPPPSS